MGGPKISRFFPSPVGNFTLSSLSGAVLAQTIPLKQHIVFACVEGFVCSVCVCVWTTAHSEWAVARNGVPSKFQEGGYR